ncbi:MAG: BspA family leucine-rich repeat surface protein [Eggerthellaceae bacterium]|nr:BspA family leucine-rich repeat surface protein [Eggerthellaceae bacterium]
MKKRLLAVVMSVVLAVSLCPLPAFATTGYRVAELTVQSTCQLVYDYNLEGDYDGGVTAPVESGSFVDVAGAPAHPDTLEFLCWKGTVNGEEAQLQPGDTFYMKSDTTLQAQWRASVDYTLTYLSGFDDTRLDQQTVKSGQVVTIADISYEREGYVFIGWLDSSVKRIVRPGDEITISGDTELVAQWEEDLDTAEAANATVGTWGSCPWTLTSDGTLTVKSGAGADTWGKSPWEKYIEKGNIKKVVFEGNVIAPADISDLFFRPTDGKSHIESIDFSGLDTSRTTNMASLLYNEQYLSSITWGSKFTTSNVTNMSCMFDNCCDLNTLDVSHFDTSSVTDMSEMFNHLNGFFMTDLDLSNFDTSNVTNMDGMFWGAINLKNLNISSFNTSKVTSMNGMFAFCEDLATIDVSHFDMSKVRNHSGMFRDCYRLVAVSLPAYSAPTEGNVAFFGDMSGMFSSCYSLKTIYSQGLDVNRVDCKNMFKDCTNLVGGNGTKYDASYVNAQRACIDTAATPGYLTKAISFDNATMTLKYATHEYTGKALKPAVTVKCAGRTLAEGIDYTVAYKGNKNVGTATVTVKGKFAHMGTMADTFKITKAANTATAKQTSVSKSYTANVLASGAKTFALPKVATKFGTAKWAVTTKDAKKALSLSGTNVKVAKGAKAGTYTLKAKASVKGTSNYTAASTKVVTVKVAVK